MTGMTWVLACFEDALAISDRWEFTADLTLQKYEKLTTYAEYRVHIAITATEQP